MGVVVLAPPGSSLGRDLGRRRRRRRRAVVSTALAATVVALFALALMVGERFHGPVAVVRVLLGADVPGATYAVRELRLPRALLAALVGACFGLSGVSFQTLLRNPLAAPDIVGVSSGASAAGVVGIVVLGWSATAVSALAVAAALATAGLIYGLAYTGGVVGARLVLVGIAVSAMLDSIVAYVIVRAARWDLQAAMRWLTGSLNQATWSQLAPVAAALVGFGGVLLTKARALDLLRLGDETATALGVRVDRTRLVVVLAAVGLVAFATAAAGPVAFVAFLAGPVAARLVGGGGSLLVPGALVGAVMVLAADLVGQWAFATRYPVGVVTGVLGAPYLVAVLARGHRVGGAA